MFPAITRNSLAVSKRLFQNSVRNSGGYGGIPGENLPFQIENRYRLTAVFAIFLGSGLAVPYIMLRHQLLKQ